MTPAAVSDAQLAATLFAIDPVGLGGVRLRGGPGPERDVWLARLRALLPPDAPIGRAPLGIADDRLLGGLDLPATLAAGRPVIARGVLAANDGGVVVLPMAERIDDGTAARLAAVLDAGEVALEREGMAARLPARLGLVLLDEGRDEERSPVSLTERLAFPHVEADPLEPAGRGADAAPVAAARRALAATTVPDALTQALCAAAAELGVASLRPPLLAVRAARAHAALCGRTEATDEDAGAAARLVLLPRARTAPEAAAEPEAEPPSPQDDEAPPDGDETPGDAQAQAVERVLEAVRAALPPGLLEAAIADSARAAPKAGRGGGGARAKSARRGRPTGSRPGALRPGDRLDIPATLRAAAPWRRLRAAGAAPARLPLRAEDFRIRRFVQPREATTIFVVDASGSSALQRLAEAKGAIELLLAKAYVLRARVALVAFRGVGAEVLLAPTRSLARARRCLADLPGGGGTPLSRGLDAGLALALGERARERTPRLVVLTDGRANIDGEGAPGRAAAERDALAASARIGEAGVASAYLDVSPRPQPGGDRFARAMRGVYAPLPYADAARMSALVDGLRERD